MILSKAVLTIVLCALLLTVAGPVTARFLSPDPVPADHENFNRYWYANNNPYTYVDPDGRWACENQGANCDVAQSAAARINNALESGDLTQRERQQLTNVKSYIGAYNDPGNAVVVKFGDAPGNAAGYVDKDGNIVLDIGKAQREAHQGTAGSAQGNTENALARNLTHEADHGARYASREAWSMSRQELEAAGYRAAAIYQKGSRWMDGTTQNAWSPKSGIIDEAVISAQAKLSVRTSCGPSACE